MNFFRRIQEQLSDAVEAVYDRLTEFVDRVRGVANESESELVEVMAAEVITAAEAQAEEEIAALEEEASEVLEVESDEPDELEPEPENDEGAGNEVAEIENQAENLDTITVLDNDPLINYTAERRDTIQALREFIESEDDLALALEQGIDDEDNFITFTQAEDEDESGQLEDYYREIWRQYQDLRDEARDVMREYLWDGFGDLVYSDEINIDEVIADRFGGVLPFSRKEFFPDRDNWSGDRGEYDDDPLGMISNDPPPEGEGFEYRRTFVDSEQATDYAVSIAGKTWIQRVLAGDGEYVYRVSVGNSQ